MNNTLTTAVAVVLVGLLGAPDLFAQPPVTADLWRAYVEKQQVGTTLKVRLKDGTRVKAMLLLVSPEAMTIQPKTRIPVEPQTVPFSTIDSLEVDRSNGIGTARAIAIGGAAAFVGLMLVVLALASD